MPTADLTVFGSNEHLFPACGTPVSKKTLFLEQLAILPQPATPQGWDCFAMQMHRWADIRGVRLPQEAPRTIVSGLQKHIPLEEMQGRCAENR